MAWIIVVMPGSTVGTIEGGQPVGSVIAASHAIGASVLSSWVVPLAMFVLVIVVCWLGLRWIESEHLETLRSVPLFAGLSSRGLRAILRSSHVVELAPGSTIIAEGEEGKGFFVVTRGTATVTVAGNEVASLEAGSYFGEMAVIDGGPRTATITARTAVDTLELTNAAFLRVLSREPDVSRAIATELHRRLAAIGAPADTTNGAPEDRSSLVELSRKLRGIEHPDWAESSSPRKGRLRLSGLVARGG